MSQDAESYDVRARARLYSRGVAKRKERRSKHVGRELWDAARIREIREDRRLSQGELASLSSVSMSEISRHERNASASNPTIDVLVRIALALEVPIDSLFDPVGAPIPRSKEWRRVQIVDTGGGARLEDRLSELFLYLKTLDEDARQRFIAGLVALLTAVGHPRAATGIDAAQNDGR